MCISISRGRRADVKVCFIKTKIALYSYLIASIGSKSAAFLAGYHPKKTPVTVQTAKGYWIRDERSTLYCLDGEVSANLLITQDGDMNKFEVPEGVEEAVSGILGSIREACDYMYTIEAYYTQCFPEPQNKWQKYYRHEKSVMADIDLKRAWEVAY
mgnify:CR=1 FL=1